MLPQSIEVDELVGSVIDNRYRIVSELGRGATGVVYRARHVHLDHETAIKVLHATGSAKRTGARFAREAKLAARLRHPNLVGALDAGELTDGRPFLVMELAEGTSLDELMDDGPMMPDRAIALLLEICDGLAATHAKGLIHRDLKPANIVVELDAAHHEHPRLIDFGLALSCDGPSEDAERLTEAGIVVGTPHYMAPEQVVDGPIDQRCDLYALGVIAYELFTGERPFSGTGIEILRAKIHVDAPRFAIRVPGFKIDPDLEAIVQRLLARDPDERFQTAGDVREALSSGRSRTSARSLRRGR